MFRDSVIAAVRTGIAALIGLLITWLVTNGIDVGEDLEANLNVALFGLFTALYNVVVSLLERKVNPYFGILLGIPKAPQYGAVGTVTPPGEAIVGDPKVDSAGDGVPPVRDERGNMSVIGAGIVALVVGLILAAVTKFDELGNVLVVIGVIAVVIGVILAFVYRGRDRGARL